MSTNTLYLGYHVSSAGGYMAMGKRAAALGANTFAFFTRNPRGGAAAKVEEADVAAFRVWAAEQGFGPLVAHSPYTLNPCSDKPLVRDFAKRAFTEDLERMELTPGCFYNFHPGSHVGQDGGRDRNDRGAFKRGSHAGYAHNGASGDDGRKGQRDRRKV